MRPALLALSLWLGAFVSGEAQAQRVTLDIAPSVIRSEPQLASYVRRVLPALVNQFISLIKESSLVYFIGLVASERELFRVGNDAASNTGNLSPLIAAGLFYLCLTIPLTHLVNFIDNRLRVGKKQKPEPDELAARIGEGAKA